MLRLLAEAELAGKGLHIGPFGAGNTFTTPSLNVFIQQAKQRVKSSFHEHPMDTMALAVSFAYLLQTKTDATSDSYV